MSHASLATIREVRLPDIVAVRFFADMRAYLAEANIVKRYAIATRQLHALRPYLGSRSEMLRLDDVIEMFLDLAKFRKDRNFELLVTSGRR